MKTERKVVRYIGDEYVWRVGKGRAPLRDDCLARNMIEPREDCYSVGNAGALI